MAEVKPFCGARYNPKKIEDPADVACLPYDCINDINQDEYYKASEYNIIRLVKAKTSPMDSGTDNVYTRAAADLNHWLESGILVKDPTPAFYYYRMSYTGPDGTPLLRKGFIGLLKIEDTEPAYVLPHEQHSREPLEDRFNLYTTTGANLSPIFATYKDEDRNVISLLAGSLPSDPIIKTSFSDGTEHSIWRITDPEICSAITKTMADKKVMIADGHHRYMAALKCRDSAREKFPDQGPEAPFEYVLTYLSPADDEGITILPTHRAVYGLKNFSVDDILLKLSKAFYIKEHPIDPDDKAGSFEEAISEAEELNKKDETFVMAVAGAESLYLLNFKKDQAKSSYPRDVPHTVRTLDVSILQQIIFENVLGIKEGKKSSAGIEFFSDETQAAERLENGAQLVFLMNPTRMETLWTLAETGRLLPVKSSCFYPKVLAGFVLHKF